MMPGILELITIPLIGAAVCAVIPKTWVKSVALGFSLLGFCLALSFLLEFDCSKASEMQWASNIPGISILNGRFGVGIDGLSLPLLLLTKFMMPIAILASWNVVTNSRAFMVLYLLLDFSMSGTFLATDILLFYVFWEMSLVPMFLLIGIWGSGERIFASLKFFCYTFAGSIFMLAAILFLVWKSGNSIASPPIQSLYSIRLGTEAIFWGLNAEALVFLGLVTAFLVKVPLFPFHTWLPDAHVQAPAGGSILLAAVMLKMGVYGLIRIAIPICPRAFDQFADPLAILALTGGIYGAWVAFKQSDVKKLVAYSSVSHLAFVILGICSRNEQGLSGAMMQSFNHGLSTGALFFIVGALYERRHSRDFSQFGGLGAVLPKLSVFLLIAVCSSIGVPGLNGFVGEFLIFWGAYVRNPWWSVIAVTGLIFGAVYSLNMVSRLLYGPITIDENRSMKDLNLREVFALSALVMAMIWLGVFPNGLLRPMAQFSSSYWSTTGQGVAHAK